MDGNTDTTAHRQNAPIVRLAWFATFVLPLILAALLLGARSTQADPSATGAVPFAFEEEFDAEEEGEFEADDCAEAEEEFEEGELGEAEVEEICDETEDEDGKASAGPNPSAPEECLLRSVHARSVANPESSDLKLTVGYTTYEPVDAVVEIRGGADRIGSIHRHLGRSGVLRIVKSLGKAQPPHRLVVQIRIPGSPRSCAKFQTQKIQVAQVGDDTAPHHERHPRVR